MDPARKLEVLQAVAASRGINIERDVAAIRRRVEHVEELLHRDRFKIGAKISAYPLAADTADTRRKSR